MLGWRAPKCSSKDSLSQPACLCAPHTKPTGAPFCPRRAHASETSLLRTSEPVGTSCPQGKKPMATRVRGTQPGAHRAPPPRKTTVWRLTRRFLATSTASVTGQGMRWGCGVLHARYSHVQAVPTGTLRKTVQGSQLNCTPTAPTEQIEISVPRLAGGVATGAVCGEAEWHFLLQNPLGSRCSRGDTARSWADAPGQEDHPGICRGRAPVHSPTLGALWYLGLVGGCLLLGASWGLPWDPAGNGQP